MNTAHDDGLSPALRDLLRQAKTGAISRRDLIQRAAALGLGAAALRSVLAAGPVGASPAQAPIRSLRRAAADPTTLTIGAFGTPSDLDPHSAYDYRSTLAILGAYEGLIGLAGDKTDQYEGIIAETWEANDDKSVWTFHLRAGVTFQDGSPVDAEAVRSSFERFLTMGIGPVNVMTRFVSDISQITAPDPKTVVFNLGKPQPLFEAAIASTYGPEIVNVKAMKQHEDSGDWGHGWAQSNAEGTGTGAYKIVQFDRDQQVVMEKYDGYWRGWEGDHFDRVVIRVVTENETRRQLIERGDVDIIDNLTAEAIDALKQNPDLVIDVSYSTQVQYLIMAVAGPLSTPAARQAMCYAFPYKEVIDGVYKGEYAKQAIGAVAEMIQGFSPDTFTYSTDLTKAKDLLAQAGVAEGTKFSLAIETGDEAVKATVQLFQANLQQLGLQLDIQQMETGTYTELLYGDSPPEERPNFMWWGWWPDYNDAWDHLYPQISCATQGSKGSNAGYYCNKQVEDLLAQSRDAVTLDTYKTALAQLQNVVSRDDPPAIYYVQPAWVTIYRKDINGFFFNPINIGTYPFWAMSRKV